MISILLASRSKGGGNGNSNLKELLQSLAAHVTNPGNYEVLIKFDDDDPGLAQQIETVELSLHARRIRYIVTPRACGYTDLHKAYLDLLVESSSYSIAYWVLSDDVLILGSCWDSAIIRHCNRLHDGVFVLCPSSTPDYFNMEEKDALTVMDNYPIWSAKWVGTAGGFGYTFSTDGWTNLLCRKLEMEHGLSVRHAVPQVSLVRRTHPIDAEGSERWHGPRAQMIAKVSSPTVQRLLNLSANALVKVIRSDNENGQSV